MNNPVLEEAAEVYVHRREFLVLHLVYLAGIALFTVVVWPARGFMYFFRAETIPQVLQATVVAQVIAVTALSLYLGMDRLADAQIIRYSEWLERTAIPVGVLFRGKLAAAVAHTTFLVLLGVPFAVIAAGPAGAPLAAVVASEAIVLTSGLAGRLAGMLISHLGETRYVIRVIGGWVFFGLLFVATIQLYPALNPIGAVVAQHSETSPFMELGVAGGAGRNPLLESGLPLVGVVALLVALFWYSLHRHRVTTIREAHRDH